MVSGCNLKLPKSILLVCVCVCVYVCVHFRYHFIPLSLLCSYWTASRRTFKLLDQMALAIEWRGWSRKIVRNNWNYRRMWMPNQACHPLVLAIIFKYSISTLTRLNDQTNVCLSSKYMPRIISNILKWPSMFRDTQILKLHNIQCWEFRYFPIWPSFYYICVEPFLLL